MLRARRNRSIRACQFRMRHRPDRSMRRLPAAAGPGRNSAGRRSAIQCAGKRSDKAGRGCRAGVKRELDRGPAGAFAAGGTAWRDDPRGRRHRCACRQPAGRAALDPAGGPASDCGRGGGGGVDQRRAVGSHPAARPANWRASRVARAVRRAIRPRRWNRRSVGFISGPNRGSSKSRSCRRVIPSRFIRPWLSDIRTDGQRDDMGRAETAEGKVERCDRRLLRIALPPGTFAQPPADLELACQRRSFGD